MTGGTEEGYRKVLSSFYKDALDRLPVLQDTPAEQTLPLFTTHVHALKSAAGTIGAAGLSKEAAELEALSLAVAKDIGKADNVQIIEEKLPGFYEHLKETAERISAALAQSTESGSGPGLNASDTAAVYALFMELKAGLEAKDMETIDRITGELAAQGLDTETTELLEAVSDLLLVSKFKAAAEKIDEYSERH
jgi:HPt (histidine-containing phosphotransfer) domain-containing protein